MFNSIRNLLIALVVVLPATVNAQQETAAVKAAIDAQNFVFKAQSAQPSRRGAVQLSAGNTIQVTKEKLVMNLPYYGRLNQGGYNTPAGFDFTATDFSYEVKEKKKGGWDVTIKIKNASTARTLSMAIETNGNMAVRVTSMDREFIAYYGVMSAPQP